MLCPWLVVRGREFGALKMLKVVHGNITTRLMVNDTNTTSLPSLSLLSKFFPWLLNGVEVLGLRVYVYLGGVQRSKNTEITAEQ